MGVHKLDMVRATKQGGQRTNLFDTLMNLVSGLGMPHDKNTQNQHTFTVLSRYELEAAYRGDWIARKIVDLPAYDMIREGRGWQANKNVIEIVEEEEKRLRYWPNLLLALKMSRLDGLSYLIIGGPGDPMQELTVEDVAKGGLKYLFPVRRHQMRAVDKEYDLFSPYFGLAKFYEVQVGKPGTRPKIHPSRVIRFVGNEVPSPEFELDGGGDSVLQCVNDAVINAGVAQAGIAGLIQEAKIDVIKVPNLMENLATDEYTSRLTSRFMMANMAKSSQNALILDSEEEWERKQINFTQLPDILKLYLQIAAGAADIPATRLIGLSPQGLNATGDTEERMYYDRIKGDQRAWLGPKIERLDEMVMRSARGRVPRDAFYVWNPLWQPTAAEAAATAKTKADTIRTIKETDLLPPEAIAAAQANQLIEDAQFPGFEDAYEKAPDKTPGQGAATAAKNAPQLPARPNEPPAPRPGQPAAGA